MKRILLSIFIIAAFMHVHASDTLTVRQVYNFAIGDTFDYAEHMTIYDGQWFFTHYSRLIISQKTFNTNLDTLTYNGNWFITNLDSIAVYQDTSHISPLVYTFFDTSSYSGRNSNHRDRNLFEGGSRIILTEGLGTTYSGSTWITSDGTKFNSDYTELIYYSKGGQHWGTPYYLLAGVNYLAITPDIQISPNPTTGSLHLLLADLTQNYQFILTDILGQEVYSSPITQSETTHNISKLSKGIYTWRIVENNAIIKTGKLIKE